MFLHFFQMFLNILISVCWHVHNKTIISLSPLVCMCLPPSLAFYMCVYRFVWFLYLISLPLPPPIVHGFLTSTSLENHNLEVLQFFIVVSMQEIVASLTTYISQVLSSPHLDVYMLGFSCFKNNVNCIKGFRFKY
jgi:hypothetical protein